jgi:hypothetical protein
MLALSGHMPSRFRFRVMKTSPGVAMVSVCCSKGRASAWVSVRPLWTDGLSSVPEHAAASSRNAIAMRTFMSLPLVRAGH